MKIFLIGGLLSIILTVVLGFLALPLLKKLKVGQPILKYVKEHYVKGGTPTMGGVFFILSSAIVFLIVTNGDNRLSILALAITLAFTLVGFIDDFIKIKFKRNEGLSALQKILFQTVISLVASYFAYESGIDFSYIPFTTKTFSLGAFSILVNSFIFIATVNSVNLTDGLDGLCSSVSVVFFISLAVIICLQINSNGANYINLNEYKNLSLYSVCLAGCLIGYLLFNSPKASVFMGDTGSLAIGGAISSISIFTANSLYIPVIGVCFLASSLSVIIQVLHYKRTKKRVFLMAPIHHHFQKMGFLESKISFTYFLITLVISLIVMIVYL